MAEMETTWYTLREVYEVLKRFEWMRASEQTGEKPQIPVFERKECRDELVGWTNT